MAVVTLAELKQQLNFSDDLGAADDVLLQRKIDAAQNHIERLLGFKLDEETYPDTIDDDYPETVPAALREAVLQLSAHWYENREASLIALTAQELPFGVWPIVNEYREYSFDAE